MLIHRTSICLSLRKFLSFCAFAAAVSAIEAQTASENSDPGPEQPVQPIAPFRKRLSLEAFGQYTFQPVSTNGTQPSSSLGGNGQTQLNFEIPALYGPALGARLEAEFLPKLSILAGAQYRSLQTKYRGYASTVVGSPATTLIYSNTSEEFSYKTWMLDLGLRVRIPMFAGEIYSGLGVGFILPFQSNYLVVYDYTAGYGTTASYTKSAKTTKNYNLGVAGILEIGYFFPLSSRVSIGISLNAIFGSVSNANRTGETTTYYGDGSLAKTTREYRKSFSLDEAAAFSAANGSNASLAIYEALNITDIGIRGLISARLF